MSKGIEFSQWTHRSDLLESGILQVEPNIPIEIEYMAAEHQGVYKGFLVDPRPDDYKREHFWALSDKVAESGRALGALIDRLSPLEKKAYVRSFRQETGFPDTKDTSQRIINHIEDNILWVADELGTSVAYSGFAEACSVGKGIALPGSDVDGLSIVIDDDANEKEFLRHLTYETNPRLTDVGSSVGILSFNRIQEFIDFISTQGGMLGYAEIEKYTALSNQGWTEAQVNSALVVVANILHHSDMVNDLGALDLSALDVANDSLGGEQSLINKTKHQARERMIDLYPLLTDDEQFAIVRILQIHSESIAFDITETSPHTEVIESLKEKGLLVNESGHLKAPWAPYPWLFRNLSVWFYYN